MKSGFPDKQVFIQTTGYVFWTVQITKNIPKDEQHFPKVTP